MMKCFFWFFIILFLPFFVSGQRVCITGQIFSTNGYPIPFATVKIMNTLDAVQCDGNGNFHLCTDNESFEVKVSSIGFINFFHSYYAVAKGKELIVKYYLKPDVLELSEFEVIGEKGPQLTYAKPETYIFDFELYENGYLFLLSENRVQKLRWVRNDSTLLDEKDKFMSDEFFRDCLGNIYLVNADSAYQVYITKGRSPVFYPGIGKDQLESVLKPCLFSLESNFFFDNGSTSMSADYTMINQVTKQKKVIRSITRKKIPEDLLVYNVDEMQDLSLKQLRYARYREEKDLFFNLLERKQIYNPLIRIRDSLYIFNHIKDSLYVYDKEGEESRVVPISYHKEKGWKRLIVTDEEFNRAFAVFSRDGIYNLRRINLKDGSLLPGQKMLEHPYPEKVRIKGHYVYYLYKDQYDYWSNKNFYRQRID